MSDHGTVARQNRVTVPSPGCLVAVMAPILAVLLVALVLMVMHYRQESANDRNEKEALARTVTQARSYTHDVVAEASGDYPGQEAVRGIAERHDGRLIAYARSGGSLTNTVRFFAEFEDTSMFGVSHSRAHRCYSFEFRLDAERGLRERTTPLDKCDAA
ncbi:hypothetical protein [Streptomyces graminilatus]|uniref:hypothetical protein n=1 Tax=Streptomyces graminilatus TaxID=1464070 RepID=UPI0006E35A4D|nr:hypothetical protein [Streptomyces graminilatus]